MVTKLKNSRKFAVVVMSFVVLVCTMIMIGSYPIFARNMSGEITETVQNEELCALSDELLDGVYFLYNQAYEEVEQSELVSYLDMDDFLLLRKYMDYEIFDFDGNALLDKEDSAKVKKLVRSDTKYAFHVSIIFNEDGNLQDVQVDGSALDEQNAYYLEESIYRMQSADEGDSSYESLEYSYELFPKNVKVIYGMSEEQLKEYMETSSGSGWEYAINLSNDRLYLNYEWVLALVAVIFGVLIAANKGWRLHEWKLFRAPLEVVLLVWFIAIGNERSYAWQVWSTINNEPGYIISSNERFVSTLSYTMQMVLNAGMWMILFGIALWGGACLQEMFVLKKSYWRERTVCAKIYQWSKSGNEQYGDKVKQGASEAVGFFQRVWKKIKGHFHKVYDEFLHMDLQENTNKMIIKALVINFFLLLLITCLWFYGIFALILYSIVLFLILRKYSQDVKKKYALLLEATNLLADGNLDAPIEGDLGIFNPMKVEIQKIQKGFQKAVQEEVKSERMKTELITNVSHDLKTPLTAIITYVDLLKSEEDPEKRKEYLEVLEKKSLRLKVLIEDLFEISKATSKSVTMNFMKVDIVGLLKQVGLECDEKIKAANLDFRWNLPEGKVVMLLDSQKTYRIFENLIVNITKYAMPHTRVYIELIDEGSHISVSMKNVSASELNFNTDEITDRFVRGDVSRNTEGSGLGLAIAKSFTELQYGTLKISTDADLFKVVIRLPKRSESEEENVENEIIGK